MPVQPLQSISYARAGHTLELTFAERGGVSGNNDELGFARAEGLEGGLVTECHYE